jgi:hypothetical protein
MCTYINDSGKCADTNNRILIDFLRLRFCQFICVRIILMFLYLLQMDVQNAHTGHCSIEDAITTMKLYQLKVKNG